MARCQDLGKTRQRGRRFLSRRPVRSGAGGGWGDVGVGSRDRGAERGREMGRESLHAGGLPWAQCQFAPGSCTAQARPNPTWPSTAVTPRALAWAPGLRRPGQSCLGQPPTLSVLHLPALFCPQSFYSTHHHLLPRTDANVSHFLFFPKPLGIKACSAWLVSPPPFSLAEKPKLSSWLLPPHAEFLPTSHWL